jgi:ADP-ribosylglycohydrolase
VLGAAIGDALGSPVEKLSPADICARFGGEIDGFAPPNPLNRGDGRHKGDARVSDDTLMTVALARVYLKLRRHLTAHDAVQLADLIVAPDTYVPEHDRRMPLIDRLFYPEKWLFHRLRLAAADPREAGIGNVVNCGCAMYVAPIGVMNAGDPDAAYAEAIDWAASHTYSYGREAAGVMAGAVAAALRPDATWQDIVGVAQALARDGTREAISAVLAAACELPLDADVNERAGVLRAAIEPFDTVRGPLADVTQIARYPSRLHSIEELPLALAFLVWGRGDYQRTVLGAVNYGRDSDSIAGMAGALAGALGGRSGIPGAWIVAVERVNRLELGPLACELADLAAEIYAADRARMAERHAAIGEHLTARAVGRR